MTKVWSKNGKREEVLRLRREDPKHEKYSDVEISRIVGLSRQRVHQILTDYLKFCPGRNLNDIAVKKSRYAQEEWYSHRKKKNKFNPKALGRKYKPGPIDKDNPKLK